GVLAAEVAEDLIRSRADRLRLLTEETGLVDVLLELGRLDGYVVRRTAVFLEQPARDHVHPLVLRLRGEDRGDQELERRAEFAGGSPVRVGLLQALQDGPRPGLQLDDRLLRHHATLEEER